MWNDLTHNPPMGIDDSGPGSAPYVGLYVVFAVSLCCSLFVVGSILRFSKLTVMITRLVLYLHLTLIMEDIVSLPYAYVDSEAACRISAFLRYYTSLANVLVVACLVIYYRNFIFEDQLVQLKKIVDKYCEWIVFVVPIVPNALPFITGSFGISESTWCVIESGPKGNLMSFVALYGWAWVFLLLTIGVMLRTVVQVYRIDKEMTSKLVGSVGLYVIVSLLAWIPRTEGRVRRTAEHTSYTGFYVETVVLYISGILYLAIFLNGRGEMSKFDDFAINNEVRFSVDDPSPGNSDMRQSKSLFVNPFYRGSSTSERPVSARDLKVHLVENPVIKDRVNSNTSGSSGKVVFEGLDDL